MLTTSDLAHYPWGHRLKYATIWTIIYLAVVGLLCGLFDCSWRLWQKWKSRGRSPRQIDPLTSPLA